MSHCWNQDNTEFSVVCIVVIGLSCFVAFVTVFCIIRIASMARKMSAEKRQDNLTSTEKVTLEMQEVNTTQLENSSSEAENCITTVESSVVHIT